MASEIDSEAVSAFGGKLGKSWARNSLSRSAPSSLATRRRRSSLARNPVPVRARITSPVMTETAQRRRLSDVFVSIHGSRQPGKVKHDFVELLVEVVNGVWVGADSFEEIELWANEKLDWLRSYLRLQNGIPSHDTFGRVFDLIDPGQFEQACRRWMRGVLPAWILPSTTIRCALAHATPRTIWPL